MADPDEVDAMFARLREHPDLASRVFEGDATRAENGDPRTRYVTVWVNSGKPEATRYTGPSMTETFTFTTQATSVSPADARALAKAVKEQLVDWTPTVPGRLCRRLTHEVAAPMDYDRDLTPPLYWITNEFDLVSDPA